MILIAIGVGVIAIARLGAFIFRPDPDLGRPPSTERVMVCNACGTERAASQREINGLFRADGPRSATGEPLFACSHCGKTNAQLVVRSTRED